MSSHQVHQRQAGIIRAAVEVDLHTLKLCSIFCQSQWIVGFPVAEILGAREIDSKDSIEDGLEDLKPLAADGCAVEAWNQCSTVGADGTTVTMALCGLMPVPPSLSVTATVTLY